MQQVEQCGAQINSSLQSLEVLILSNPSLQILSMQIRNTLHELSNLISLTSSGRPAG